MAIDKKILYNLKGMVSKLSVDMPTFGDVPITEFEKPELIDVCKLFWRSYQLYARKFLELQAQIDI